jgi:phage host-nuclease inhibitor protein Gam
MKRLLLQRLFLLLLPLALVACAERRQDVDNDAPATLDAASEQVRTDATRAAEDLDRRIAALERSAEAATGEARERYNETLNELRLKRTALQADLDRFATVTQDDFDDLRDDVAEKQAELEADLDEATLRLADTKADFEAAARRRMAALDRDIERLEANALVATGAAEDAAEASLETLKGRRRALGTRLDDFADDSDDDFRRLRGDLAEDVAELRRDVIEATNRLAARTDTTRRD